MTKKGVNEGLPTQGPYPPPEVYFVTSSYNRFIENIKLNNVKNVSALLIALSNMNKIGRFFTVDERIGASGNQIDICLNEKGETFEPISEYNVIEYTLDSLIDQFDLLNPSYIKIDVDGVEDKIVQGMKNTLTNPDTKSILIEVNHYGTKYKHIDELLTRSGFTKNNDYNKFNNHSNKRRSKNGIVNIENIFYTRFDAT